MGSLIEQERQLRIERNSKILKRIEDSNKEPTPFKFKDLNVKKLSSSGKKLNYKTNTKGLFGVGKL